MKGTHFYSDGSIADLYAWFADETSGSSPTWERLCRWIAVTPRIQERLDTLPGRKRQPNVFLGALRYLDGPLEPGDELLRWLDQNWDDVRRVAETRETQTNEPGRCATLAPVLAALGERIALIEVGMSAGLCLFPDRYGYRWHTADGTVEAGPTDVTVVDCRVSGEPRYDYALPNVVWRAGIDPNPLDPADPDDARWLRSLVWPGQTEREQRLAACLQAAADEPVVQVKGDAVDDLPALVEHAPDDATVVVMHSAVLSYLQRDRRAAFERVVGALPVRWLSNEGERVVPSIRDKVEPWDREPSFVMSLDGEPIARTGPHGQFLHWL